MVRTGKWQYDYSLTLIDSVHSTSPEENLFISPTAYDKANNPIHPFPGITATVIDSSIVEMDNVEPKFLIVDIEGETPNITELAPGSNSFINSREVAYELSEDLASGKIIWSAKFGSTPEDPNVPDDGYEVSLVGNELLASDNDNNAALHELKNGGPLVLTLKDSAQYTVTFTGTDLAGNEQNEPEGTNVFVSTSVTYDTTKPSVYLDYYLDVVASDYEDTIWVTFSEPISPDNPTPKISIDFLDNPSQGETISLQSLIMDSTSSKSSDPVDSTKWFYPAIMPRIGGVTCSTSVEILASDLAGNALLDAGIFHVTGFNIAFFY